MKTLSQNIRSGFVVGFSALVTMIVGGTIYAQVNNIWTNPSELETSRGNSLSSESWNKILSNQKYLLETMSGLGEAPQNSVIAFASSSCPSGWKPADGTNGTPDLRGVFIRGANNFGTGENNRDQDRATAGSGVLTYQNDAIREIQGTFGKYQDTYAGTFDYADGVFKLSGWTNSAHNGGPYHGGNSRVEFKASNIVPTGSDNRPKNVALIYCVKS